MYLRFISTAIDEDSHKPRGLFVEAYKLLDDGDITKEEWKELRSALDWFNLNLPHPPKNFQANRAIFWFREDSVECISKIWEMVHMLRLHSISISVQKCRHLRNISYSDKFQVAAYSHPLDDRIIEH